MTATTPPESVPQGSATTNAHSGGKSPAGVGARRHGSPSRRRRTGRAFAPRDLLQPRVQLPILLLFTALALTFSWQVRLPFAVAIGGPDDSPYLTGFYEGETAQGTEQRFRWTRDHAVIAIPGFGATPARLTLRLQGSRPGGTPATAATITLGDGTPQPLPLSPELRDYTIAVPASAFRDGGVSVTLDTPTYRPTGDRRDLGIVVTNVELRDAPGAGGLIAPPLRTLAMALLAVFSVYGVCALALRSVVAGALAGWIAALTFLIFALGPRAMLTLYAPALAALIGVTALVSVGVAIALGWLGQRCGWASDQRALGGAALIAGAHALALLVGMRHPQFRTSDLMLNVHRLEFVQRGEWVFTLALPGTRALEAPYPPLFYAVMLPFSWLIEDKALLVEASATLACALGILLTFFLARRVCGADGPALWAAGICAIVPITYGLASAGNFANLFGQGVATGYLVALILTWGHWRRPLVAVGLTFGLLLALLGHFGIFLSLLVTVPLLILILLLRGGITMRGQALALAASFVFALLLSWAVYYHFHDTLLLGHATAFLNGDMNARGGSAAQAPLAARLRNEWHGLLLWWGWPAVPLALAGINLLRRTHPTPPLTLVLTWLGTVFPFLLAAIIASLSVRFHLFVAPALAVVAGWALWQLWRTHRLIGPLASIVIALFWGWQSLAYWVDRVLHAYH